MRIVHATHAYHPAIGGAELYAKRVAEELVVLGHEVSVVTSDLESAEGFYQLGVPGVSPATEVIKGVSVNRLPVRSRGYRLASGLRPGGRTGAWTEAILARMEASYERGFRPYADSADVVMTLPHLFANVRAVIAAHRDQPFPLVMAPLLHESDPNWSTPEISHALRPADAVLALTRHEAGRLADAYGTPADRVFVCPPGVDMPTPPDVVRPPQRVLFLGRLVSSKGVDLLLDAMNHVWALHPDAELVLAGPREAGVAGISTDRLGGRLTELGAVAEKDKSDLLASVTTLVLPSATESFGIVLMEAMAHRTPVIAVDTPIAAEVVKHGETGLLASDNAAELGNAIISIISDEALAARLAGAGYDWVSAARSWANTARAVQEAYQHAISHFGASS